MLRSLSLDKKLGDVYDGLFGVALSRPILYYSGYRLGEVQF
ncbi:hypothetical protein [Nostoc sp.]